ncbi:MAG TPA: NAD(P)-dependent oxidoreductase, partial [Nocardioidaceae bacterium]|nr:NAD(P)-dependent oxidoreductase [Nocardioidaceae bacterium]
MRVAVTGATGVIGSAAVTELVRAGHEVVGMARTPEKAQQLADAGASAVRTSLLDHDGMVAMFDGADAVCNFATHVPVGLTALRPGAWRINDRLRTDGVRRVLEAAREAGVRRVIQESVSFLYADKGEDWIDEDAPLDITHATEPASV